MIHSARPTVSPVANVVFTWNCFGFLDFDGRMTFENNDHYWLWLWVGRVDQSKNLGEGGGLSLLRLWKE